MKNEDRGVKSVARKAVLDLSVGIIGAVLGFDRDGDEEHYLPLSSGRDLLTDRGFPDPTGHKAFEAVEGQSAGFFVLAPRFEAICLLVLSASQT